MGIYSNEWDLNNEINTASLGIVRELLQMVKEQMPEYYEFFPFRNGFKADGYKEGNFYCLRIIEEVNQVPFIGNLTDNEFINRAKTVFLSNQYPGFDDCYECVGNQGYRYDMFTYIGRAEGNKLCWNHTVDILNPWLNNLVIPRVLEMNTKRVTDAIPTPPSFNPTKLFENIYVIESAEGIKQGTAFHLKGFGIITCDHCIRDEQSDAVLTDLVLYRGNQHFKKYPVNIERTNKDIDVSIIKTDNTLMSEGLEIGNSDTLKQLDHIAVAGFPNYNFGDQGIFSPGLVVGFRAYSGIRHILVNSPLISGNSGGPAFDKQSKVIGIAVTGADKMSNAHTTEKHGLIPIEVIKYLM